MKNPKKKNSADSSSKRPSHRTAQVNELIRHELSMLLATEIEFPANSLATVMRVEVSKDLRHARVWLSIIPGMYIGKVLTKIKSQAGHLQFLLNQRLSMKPLPRINFMVDTTEAQASTIDALLDRIKETG